MYKVNTQDFQGNWEVKSLETKQEVFEYVTALDMVSKLEIEGVPQEGDVLQLEELENWLNGQA